MVSEKIFLTAALLAAVLSFGCVQQPLPTPATCTLDAKVCPDGSAVGRVPPSCEFAPCPTATPVPSDDLPPMPPDDQGNLQGATSTPEPTSSPDDELPPLPE